MLTVFWILFLALFVYEAVALKNARKGDTITEIVRSWARSTWLVPFGFGLLMGHFFWCECAA